MDVLGVGMACPLGLRSRLAIAAVRAGLSQVQSILVPEIGDRLCSRLEPDDDDADPLAPDRATRAELFAARALGEIAQTTPWPTTPRVLLAAPEPGPGDGLDVTGIWRRVAARSQLVLPREVELFASAGAGVFDALAAVLAAPPMDTGELVLVGGFDCMSDDVSLRRWATVGDPRQTTPADPRILGEGAAFLLLSRRGRRPELASPLARLTQLVVTREPEPFASGQPPRAKGLTAAFAQLRTRAVPRVDLVHAASPLQGWWGQMLNYAYLRNAELMPEPFEPESLHDWLGDLGAAAGAAALVAAVLHMRPLVPRPGARSHARALVYACSDLGHVGASVIEQP